ncbi:MAG: ATP-grasp domain-containing protein [Phycisphaeraceae bacterium]|nr:ATP-grasp domain-containing protein [Phycisphaeraceae bacterium]
MFSKILIANRGEIAVRIARTAREMGVRVVAVHSRPDAGAPHTEAADEVHGLPGDTSQETYLRGDRIIEIAKACGAQAIHPGYGFLSENAGFARACADAGLVFIGPPPAAIERMGDKILAKRVMEAAGVPVVPGWSSGAGAGGDAAGDAPDDGIDAIRAAADRVGYPLLVKAAAGGGGKGMRIVERDHDLPAAVAAARREAGSAFGDSRVFLERYIPRARHVEIQVFGDLHGTVIHLCERECSIQRRHQKIIEEAPAPGLDPAMRRAMGEAAVRGAKAIGYVNAGTFEFIVDDAGTYFFLEVNTRLQVEHPVTECVLGLDLVRLQLEVAAGLPLSIRQEDAVPRGSAIECRIYAEDPARGFLPSTGRIQLFEPPVGPGIRMDAGVRSGSEVTVHYDPMLGKLIAWAPTRDAAIDRMHRALTETVVLGPVTNTLFMRDVLDHPEFRAGRTHTKFLEEHGIVARAPVPDARALIAAGIAALETSADGRGGGADRAPGRRASGGRTVDAPWAQLGAWRML